MKYLQASTTVRGVFLLLLAIALLSLASCKGGGSKGGGGGNGGGGATALTVSAISAGGSHTCAIVEGKAAWCWGRNNDGQLGDNSETARNTPVAVLQTPETGTTPAVLLNSGVTAISAGQLHTCAIHNTADEDETEVLAAKCWGRNSSGQLGNGSSGDSNSSLLPVQVTDLDSGVSAISAGENHTCALHSGAAKCWGVNTNGQLGNGVNTGSNTPVDVVQTRADNTDPDPDEHTAAVLLDSGVTVISAGSFHNCAIHSGAAKCWGSGNNGRLGNGSETPSNIAVQVTGLDMNVTAISAGGSHTCAIHGGEAKCWGLNGAGQLGNGVNTGSAIPMDVTGLDMDVTAISAGDQHTCAVHNGEAKCWGNNTNGRLGDGSETNRHTAVDVTGLDSDVTAISTGNQHTCAIHNDIAKCWGNNANGRLGVGELADGADDDDLPDTSAFTPQTLSFE